MGFWFVGIDVDVGVEGCDLFGRTSSSKTTASPSGMLSCAESSCGEIVGVSFIIKSATYRLWLLYMCNVCTVSTSILHNSSRVMVDKGILSYGVIISQIKEHLATDE